MGKGIYSICPQRHKGAGKLIVSLRAFVSLGIWSFFYMG